MDDTGQGASPDQESTDQTRIMRSALYPLEIFDSGLTSGPEWDWAASVVDELWVRGFAILPIPLGEGEETPEVFEHTFGIPTEG